MFTPHGFCVQNPTVLWPYLKSVVCITWPLLFHDCATSLSLLFPSPLLIPSLIEFPTNFCCFLKRVEELALRQPNIFPRNICSVHSFVLNAYYGSNVQRGFSFKILTVWLNFSICISNLVFHRSAIVSPLLNKTYYRVVVTELSLFLLRWQQLITILCESSFKCSPGTGRGQGLPLEPLVCVCVCVCV